MRQMRCILALATAIDAMLVQGQRSRLRSSKTCQQSQVRHVNLDKTCSGHCFWL